MLLFFTFSQLSYSIYSFLLLLFKNLLYSTIYIVFKKVLLSYIGDMMLQNVLSDFVISLLFFKR